MSISIITYNGSKILTIEELQSFSLQVYNNLKAINTKLHTNVLQYLAELNGKSVIPDPDDSTGSWRTNIKSSIFFQKTIFAYLYLRSLMQKSTEKLLSFDSPTFTYLPSAFNMLYAL